MVSVGVYATTASTYNDNNNNDCVQKIVENEKREREKLDKKKKNRFLFHPWGHGSINRRARQTVVILRPDKRKIIYSTYLFIRLGAVYNHCANELNAVPLHYVYNIYLVTRLKRRKVPDYYDIIAFREKRRLVFNGFCAPREYYRRNVWDRATLSKLV